ncbi:hypothetical protein ABLV89_03690 [Staphylococcus equorum]
MFDLDPFSNPFTASRQFNLDHLSNGRIGWNLMPLTDLEALNHSMEMLPDHNERYQFHDYDGRWLLRLGMKHSTVI